MSALPALLPAPPSVAAALPLPPDPQLVDQVETTIGELIALLVPTPGAAGRNRGRPPILPAMLLWSGMVICVLRRATAQLDVWRLLTAQGLWHFPAVPISDDAVTKRLETGGPAALERLFTDLTALLVERLTPGADPTLAPFATEVVAIDETTLDPVARQLPILRQAAAGDDCVLPGKLAGVFDVRRQLWRRIVHVADPHQNEKAGARTLIADLAAGTLLLFDLGYFAFAWFDDLTDQGYWWVSRLREKTSYEVIHTFYQDGDTRDALVWLGKHRADRAKHAVRLVSYRHGTTTHRFITNVRDPKLLPLPLIARLYGRRWDIEMAVNLAKTELGLHLLWSGKTAVVLSQVWAVLIVAQILQALRLTVAATAHVDVFEVSLPLLVKYLPQYAARGHDPIAAFVADGVRLRFIRPSRRTKIVAPEIPLHLLSPPPPDLVLVRTPRYARRKCDPCPTQEHLP
jgi:hypothetical protein